MSNFTVNETAVHHITGGQVNAAEVDTGVRGTAQNLGNKVGICRRIGDKLSTIDFKKAAYIAAPVLVLGGAVCVTAYCVTQEGREFLRMHAEDRSLENMPIIEEAQSNVRKLLGSGNHPALEKLFGLFPQGGNEDRNAIMYSAMLRGAHVVFNDVTWEDFKQGVDFNGLTDRSASSSHYGAAPKEQYGYNLTIEDKTPHVLFGKTADGKVFMQFERHAAYSGVGESLKHLSTVFAHLKDWANHSVSDYAQVGPYGMVYASEKAGNHLIVDRNGFHQAGQ